MMAVNDSSIVEMDTGGVSDLSDCNSLELKGFYAQQISPEEFQRQKGKFTQSAVSDLERSPAYLEWCQRCSTCSSSWYGGQYNNQCQECGGFAMTRPCAICDGHCDAKWSRDVHMSHTFKEAHWKGTCRLSETEQRHYLVQKFVANSADVLCEAMEDLGKT